MEAELQDSLFYFKWVCIIYLTGMTNKISLYNKNRDVFPNKKSTRIGLGIVFKEGNGWV